jgi:hypothetical protein
VELGEGGSFLDDGFRSFSDFLPSSPMLATPAIHDHKFGPAVAYFVTNMADPLLAKAVSVSFHLQTVGGQSGKFDYTSRARLAAPLAPLIVEASPFVCRTIEIGH